jgi:hypothetical protein
MDTGIQALLVLMAFATVHERVIELVRRVFLGRAPDKKARGTSRDPGTTGLVTSPKRRTFIEGSTVGPWSVVVAIVLAFATNANLLYLFIHDSGAKQSKFFDAYLKYSADVRPWDLQHVFGMVLMGLSTMLGSKFWHDLAYGLMDVRRTITDLPDQVRKAIEPPAAAPPPSGVQVAG